MGGLGPPNDDRLSPLLCNVGSGSVFFFWGTPRSKGHPGPKRLPHRPTHRLSSPLPLSYNPFFFGQKRSPGGGQNCFWAIFVNRPIKPLGKIFQTKKNRFKKSFFFSELQEHEVRICVQTNFPIIIPILLNGYHKFAKSIGPNTSGFRHVAKMKMLSDFFFRSGMGPKIGTVENKREIFLNLGM